MKEKNASALALLPIGLFVILYLGTGIVFEYVLKIEMGFYSVPVVVVFLIALCVAMIQTKGLKIDEKLAIMGEGVGDKNIIIMILIFLEAGIFVGVVGRESAQSVAYMILSIIPPQFAVLVIFFVACFVSMAMGTSVGTITLIAPIGLELAIVGGINIPLMVGTVVGGAMFGDNLSMISDTTIAACSGQGCKMKDKLKYNLKFAIPSAVIAALVILVFAMKQEVKPFDLPGYNVIQIIPYIVVLLLAAFGMNILFVLPIGIGVGVIVMLATNAKGVVDLISSAGEGAAGMFETTMVAILVAAICALVRYNGGFKALLNRIYAIFKNSKGGMLGMGILVSILDIATANNTVAIVVANPIAKEMGETYDVSPHKTAAILDTFSCIIQGALPYGAQMLVAIAATKAAGLSISGFAVIPYLFYPMALLLVCICEIVFTKGKKADPGRKERMEREKAIERAEKKLDVIENIEKEANK